METAPRATWHFETDVDAIIEVEIEEPGAGDPLLPAGGSGEEQIPEGGAVGGERTRSPTRRKSRTESSH